MVTIGCRGTAQTGWQKGKKRRLGEPPFNAEEGERGTRHEHRRGCCRKKRRFFTQYGRRSGAQPHTSTDTLVVQLSYFTCWVSIITARYGEIAHDGLIWRIGRVPCRPSKIIILGTVLGKSRAGTRVAMQRRSRLRVHSDDMQTTAYFLFLFGLCFFSLLPHLLDDEPSASRVFRRQRR